MTKKINLNEREVIESYEKLQSIEKVAKVFNCGDRRISRILKENNVEMFSNKLFLNERKVVETYKKLRSANQTAKIFSCGVTKIANILNENNVERFSRKF